MIIPKAAAATLGMLFFVYIGTVYESRTRPRKRKLMCPKRHLALKVIDR